MANIIISGAGQVGKYTAEVLEKQNDAVTVIDINETQLLDLENSFDGRLLHGSACHVDTLKMANIENCDAFLAATSLDEVNLTTGAIAKKLGAKNVIARVHSGQYFNNSKIDYAKTFSVDHLICPEQLTSHAICSKLQNPGVNAIQSFAKSEIELHQYVIKKNCTLVSKPLAELGLPTGVRVASIRRNDQGFYPVADSQLDFNDVISIIGPQNTFAEIDQLFGAKISEKIEIAIVGASSLAEWLIESLDLEKIKVKLFETDFVTAEVFAEKFPEITVINDNPLEEKVFEEENLDRCSAYVAVADNEELNILGALQAKKLGVRLTIATINNPTYLKYIGGFGIDFTFSPRIEGAKELIRLLDSSPVKIRSKIERGHVHIYELQSTAKGQSTGERLIDVSFPKTSIVVAIERKGDVFAPNPGQAIEAGDTMYIIGPPDIEKQLEKMFIG
jgi:trk system potassium uptake protein